MSNDLNKCLFIGRLGADPDVRYMPNGKAVANFRIAVGSSWKDKQTGDKKEQTEWVSIVAFDKLGEICAKHLRKGSQVFIEGAMRTRKWADKEGKDRYTTEIIAQSMQMLGGKPQEREPERHVDEFDDDIPFAFAFATPLGSILAGLVLAGLVIAA
ncbi:MAG TPA: single-stranded DNA-binding protein [Steroidobacteraceae bacterium]|nr:single-stranded DNA-binding protein [Steroidobacteraceae bacterium]